MIRKLLFIAGFLVLIAANMVQANGWPIFPPREPVKADVPIIMYHLITNNPKYKGKFGIGPDDLEADLVYLQKNGYTTVLMEDLLAFTNKRKPLPEKPIVLSFDDGRFSDHLYVLPLLEKHKMKAVFSIIGVDADENTRETSSNKKPHMGWDQVAELAASKYTEVQNHSYDLHGDRGSGRLKGESKEKYQERLRKDTSKQQDLIKQHTGVEPTTYTYPLGIVSEGSQDVLEELGFGASLSCYEGMNNLLQGEPLFLLKRNNRPHGKSVADILNKLEKKI